MSQGRELDPEAIWARWNSQPIRRPGPGRPLQPYAQQREIQMPTRPDTPIETRIVDAWNSGALLNAIIHELMSRDSSSDDILEAKSIELHNVGTVDLLSLTGSPEFHDVGGSSFFVVQHFFCKVIPRIMAPTEDMMRCVLALVQKGGEDLAANAPNAAFSEWCAADLSRAQEVVNAARRGDELAMEFLTFALTAAGQVDEAMAFAEHYDDSRRLSGITALGRLDYATPGLANQVFRTLLHTLDRESNDNLRANVLLSTLEIAVKTALADSEDTLCIVRRVCETPGSTTHFACARSLWSHADSLSKDVVALLLQALEVVDPAHTRTIREIDVGLAKLLSTTCADEAVEFVATLLRSSGNLISLADFESFNRELMQAPNDRFNALFVAWMLSGDRTLCDGLRILLSRADRGEMQIDVTIEAQSLSPVEQIFLCRKAIGYLFFQPVAATSVLVSVLRVCDSEVAATIRDYLFEPLLLNYGGAVKQYLQGVESSDLARSHVDAALKRGEEYLGAIQSAERIRELWPSEHERQIERVRFYDQMRLAHKVAEKRSVFLSFVSRSVILHGRRTMSFHEGPNKERRAVEMELKEHSATVELPRMEIVDPIGLDYMLRLWRVERMTRETHNSELSGSAQGT